eukprot:gb/GECH01015020.1/.p1 GENE.gb/GECH01015020.1/~~gb/GECH01015020.1/.p1  ORF type:complete len:773 (+),score=96.25 gb/GECH01015020.1/:1-2319(+)
MLSLVSRIWAALTFVAMLPLYVVDQLIAVSTEATKTIYRELWLVGKQLVDLYTRIILHIVHKPGHYRANTDNDPPSPPVSNTVSYSPQLSTPTSASALTPSMSHSLSYSSISDSNKNTDLPPTTVSASHPDPAEDNRRIRVHGPSTRLRRRRRDHPPGKNKEDRTKGGLYSSISGSLENLYRSVLDPEYTTVNPKSKSKPRRRNLLRALALGKVSSSSEGEKEDMPNFADESDNDSTTEMDYVRVSKREEGVVMALYTGIKWVLLRILKFPQLFWAPRRRSLRLSTVMQHPSVKDDKVHYYEKMTSGILEDINIASLQFFDQCAAALRLLFRFRIRSAAQELWHGVQLFGPGHLLASESIDQRSVGELIRHSGYPHEHHGVATEDGYILSLDRIPNPSSPHVLFFQHGIVDSAFAWVANGTAASLALRGADQGYDVFMGNFRGCGKCYHHRDLEDEDTPIPEKEFWDFSMNEHAFQDIPAFIKRIVALKSKEMSDSNSFKITSIAHSMGAGTMLAYLVHCGIHNIPHHINRALLLSPAGCHDRLPWIGEVSLPFFVWLGRKLGIYSTVIPTEPVRVLVTKVMHDLFSHPATRDLVSYLFSQFLLGGNLVNLPLRYVHNLVYNFKGTSVKVLEHFIQMWSTAKFQAYDYGPLRNLQEYGSEEPLNFLEHYDKIDIPVHIVVGSEDRVIPAKYCLRHFQTLSDVRPDLARLKVFKGAGHIDLTLGRDERIISYIIQLLQRQKLSAEQGIVSFSSIGDLASGSSWETNENDEDND